MARFARLPSWDHDDEETRTIELRSDTHRKSSDTDIEVHPAYAAPEMDSDSDWEKPTTTFVAPNPVLLQRPIKAGSATDWIGPQSMRRSSPAVNAFDPYAMPPAQQQLTERVC